MAADLFWSYWDTSLRFGVLAVLLLVATPVLKRWISPKWLCWAWAALILRLAVPIALPYSGSIFNLSESLQPSTWTDAFRSGVVDAGWGETVIPRFSDQDDFVRSTVIGFSWEDAILLLWVSGIIVLVVGVFINAIRLRRFFDSATRHNSGRVYDIFKDVRHRFRINANVPLLVSSEVQTPGIAGVFNPRVVVPQSCVDELNDEELRCVLLHELTHYRRGDLFVHHALQVVCFVHWYNPLVWLVMRQFKIAMEQACDADVLDSDCIETAQEYGLTLLHVMQTLRTDYGSPAGALCLLGNRKNHALKDRIHLIAAPKARNPWLAAMGIGVFGFSFMFAVTGETVVEKEAERLFSLTRFSGPALYISPQPDNSGFNLKPANFTLETTRWQTPQSWLKDVDVSDYRGQKITVLIQYRLVGGDSSREFWLNVKDTEGRVIASVTPSRERVLGSSRREIKIDINLSNTASELVCGLSNTGSSVVRVDSLEVVTGL